jgi:hypothetical protein
MIDMNIIFRTRQLDLCFLLICFVCISAILVCVGCSKSRYDSSSKIGMEGLVIADDDYDAAWDEIVEVLREHYFIPDRQDRRTGIIITHPSVSQQWFEFWRDDTRGWYQWAESSLHTIRRIVEVRFIPKDNTMRKVLKTNSLFDSFARTIFTKPWRADAENMIRKGTTHMR